MLCYGVLHGANACCRETHSPRARELHHEIAPLGLRRTYNPSTNYNLSYYRSSYTHTETLQDYFLWYQYAAYVIMKRDVRSFTLKLGANVNM